MPTAVDSLYTTVKNTSGAARVFGFLGERGKRLDANESITIPGDLLSTLASQTSKRKFHGLQRALAANDLQLIATPAVILYDPIDDVSRQLALRNNNLGVVDPTWEEASSAFQDDV